MRYVSVSLIGHAALALCLLPSLYHITHYRVPGKMHVVYATVVEPPHKLPAPVNHIHNKGTIKLKQVKPTHSTRAVHKAAAKKREGKRLNELVVLLYRTISAHKAYPSAALSLGQEGTVDVAFSIHPDGRLDQVSVLKSSGYDDLDQAAICAVKAASPIAGVSKYLHQTRQVAVPIRFSPV